MAVQSDGNPHISYYDAAQHALKYAVGSPLLEARCDRIPTPTPTPAPAPVGTPAAGGIVERQVSHCLDDAYATVDSTTELHNNSPFTPTATAMPTPTVTPTPSETSRPVRRLYLPLIIMP